jgi:tRNA(adenine34) deaminase
MNSPEELMRLAIDEAELSVREGNGPFAVVVVDPNGKVVWKDHDRQKELSDPTAHGEINAIRYLCGCLKTLSLNGYTFVTTSEPCPTCLTGMIKAQVSVSYYGAKTEATASLPLSAEMIASYAKKYPIKVLGGILANECLAQRVRLLAK